MDEPNTRIITDEKYFSLKKKNQKLREALEEVADMNEEMADYHMATTAISIAQKALKNEDDN